MRQQRKLRPVKAAATRVSGGDHQYFPTIEAAAEGGYGAANAVAPAAVGAGEEIMNTALLWLFQMRGKLGGMAN